jgi:hypothetical protein
VLIDASTNQRHPHWLEIDISAGNGTEPVFIVQPAVPLKYATRYVFGVK